MPFFKLLSFTVPLLSALILPIVSGAPAQGASTGGLPPAFLHGAACIDDPASGEPVFTALEASAWGAPVNMRLNNVSMNEVR